MTNKYCRNESGIDENILLKWKRDWWQILLKWKLDLWKNIA